MIKILIIIEIIKISNHNNYNNNIIMIIIIMIIIITTTIIKCRGRYRTPTAINTELLMTLHNGRIPLSNVKKSSPLDVARTPYMPLK